MALARDSFNAPRAGWWKAQKNDRWNNASDIERAFWNLISSCQHATWPSKRDISIPNVKPTVARQDWRHCSGSRHHPTFARRTSLHRASNAPCPARVGHGTRNTPWEKVPPRATGFCGPDASCAPATQILDEHVFKSSCVKSRRDKLKSCIHMLSCSASSFQRGNSARGKRGGKMLSCSAPPSQKSEVGEPN